MRDETALEAEIQAKGLNAPRLTPELIDGKIASYAFHVFPGTSLTICAITLVNGFQVTGESAAASRANFDRAIGEKIAFEKAREKIWMLEGYLLRERLASSDKSGKLMSSHAYRDSGTGEFTTKTDAMNRPNETQRETFGRGQDEIVTRDIANNCWRNAKGDAVPDSEVMRVGERHIRSVPDTVLGETAGKLIGHDRSEEGAPSFKG